MFFYKTLDLFLEPKCFLAIENHYKVAVAFYGCPANFLVIQGILGYYRKNQVAEMNRLSGKENVKGRDISRTIDEFKYKGKTYTFVIYERDVNMEVRELK